MKIFKVRISQKQRLSVLFAAVLPRLWAELKIYKERRYYIAEEAIGYNGGVRPDRIEAALYDHGSGWRRRYASAAMVM